MKSFAARNLLLSVAFSGLSLATAQVGGASADPLSGLPVYVSLFAGGNWMNDIVTHRSGGTETWNPQPGYIIGGAIGMSFNDMLRAEVELSHSHNPFATTFDGLHSDLGATYLLGNLWLDWKNTSPLTPYAGGGLGVGWANADQHGLAFHGLSGGNSGLAFQLGAGIKYQLTQNVSLDLGYRYKSLNNITFHDGDGFPDFHGGNLNSHNVQLGMTFNF